MNHPKLGGMLVYMDDIEQKQKEGWVVGEKPFVDATGFEVVESPGDRYEKKFGKRPHWKMKDETIEDALKE